jgi:hypothetical protein
MTAARKFFQLIPLWDAEIADVPFLAVLAGCSVRRPERSVASHISEGQRNNAPVSAAKNGISVVSASQRVFHFSRSVGYQ